MINKKFEEAVKQKNKSLIRLMIKNSLLMDPSLKEFDELIIVAEKGFKDSLYDKHDGEEFKSLNSDWNKEYLNNQLVRLIKNFSKERIDLLKKMCQYIYKDDIEKMKSNSNKNRNRGNTSKSSSQKNGPALAVVGVVVAAVATVVIVVVKVITGKGK